MKRFILIRLLCLKLIATSCFVVKTSYPFKRMSNDTKKNFVNSAGLKKLAKSSIQESENDIENKEVKKDPIKSIVSRRNILQQSSILASTTLLSNIKACNSMGLVQFPCKEGTLSNTYNVMRAGQSLLEESNLYATNPLFLTNREAALSPTGIQQVRTTCQSLQRNTPTVIYFSLAAKCVDTSDVIVEELKISRNRVLPEFTFLDQRSVGLWDMLPLNTTESAIWALDYQEAGAMGLGGRPPPHDDGTPHETLADQASRLRQFLSVIETSRAGENVLFIFPDGTGPALLTCLISGIPLNRVHEFELQPGEIRFNLTYENGQQLASISSQPSPEYENKIMFGKEQLAFLYSTQDEIKASRDIKPVAVVTPTPTPKAASKKEKVESKESESSSRLSAIVGSLGVVLTAGLALFNNEETKKETELVTQQDSTIAITNDTAITTTTPLYNMPLYDNKDLVLVQETKEKIANEAMEDYMNQDDGFDAYLASINDIMNDDDDFLEKN